MLQDSLYLIESEDVYPEKILYVNYDYLNPISDLYDQLIQESQNNGYDSIFPAIKDFSHYWIKNEKNDYIQINSSFKTRNETASTYKAVYGLGCLTSAHLIRQGKLVGGKIGIYVIENPENTLRLKDFSLNKSLIDFFLDK